MVELRCVSDDAVLLFSWHLSEFVKVWHSGFLDLFFIKVVLIMAFHQ